MSISTPVPEVVQRRSSLHPNVSQAICCKALGKPLVLTGIVWVAASPRLLLVPASGMVERMRPMAPQGEKTADDLASSIAAQSTCACA